MPYIGKSPVGGGFHKLDNLTASATATYALTLGSAAYYPETANQLLVSLNGVIQAPQDSFTVSGSNLIFDTALTASDSIDFVVALGDVLGVQGVTDGAVTTNKIANGAVTAAKIGSSAVDLTSKVTGVLPVANGGTGSNSVYLSRYILSSDKTTDGTITNWVSPSQSKQVGTIGTAVSVSSGIFTFPKTGIWKIKFQSRILSVSGDSTIGLEIQVTDDNNTYSVYGFGGEGHGTGTMTGSLNVREIINVDNVSNVKAKLVATSITSGCKFYGSNNNDSRTQVIFERIADAQ